MEEANLETSVRTRLLLAGLAEMEEYGEGEFSLRRVAKRAQVSCAAPYRHFKDKEELIDGVFSYILEKWQLLCREITRAFAEDTARRLTELSVAYLRFWLSNPKDRVIFLARSSSCRRSAFDASLCRTAELLAEERAMSPEESHRLTFAVLSTVYGALFLAPTDGDGILRVVSDVRDRLAFVIG